MWEKLNTSCCGSGMTLRIYPSKMFWASSSCSCGGMASIRASWPAKTFLLQQERVRLTVCGVMGEQGPASARSALLAVGPAGVRRHGASRLRRAGGRHNLRPHPRQRRQDQGAGRAAAAGLVLQGRLLGARRPLRNLLHRQPVRAWPSSFCVFFNTSNMFLHSPADLHTCWIDDGSSFCDDAYACRASFLCSNCVPLQCLLPQQ